MTVIESTSRLGTFDTATMTEPSRQAEKPVSTFPIATTILLVAIGAAYAAELAYGVEPAKFLAPSARTLLAFGGLHWNFIVGDGQWYRLFSAPLLHLDIAHLVFNGVALFFAGRILEPIVGRLWFAAIFVVGGIAGGLMSLLVNAHDLVSVGASGAIMALFAAVFILSFRVATGADRTQLQGRALGILIPSLLPFAGGVGGQAIDYGAHFGGAIGGAFVCLPMLASWRRTDDQPRLRIVAATIVAGAALAVAFSAVAIARHYEEYTLARFIAPEAELPSGLDAIVAQSQALVDKYPRDPRARLFRAISLTQSGDLKGAEDQMRLALSEHDILRVMMTPAFRTHLQSYLALILADEGRTKDAKEAARAGCADASAKLHSNLVKARLCESRS